MSHSKFAHLLNLLVERENILNIERLYLQCRFNLNKSKQIEYDAIACISG